METEAIIIYERVLNGEIWPENYIGNPSYKNRALEILRYLFFEKLKIRDYDKAKTLLNAEFIQANKLQRVIKSFERPVELFPNEYDYILWELFPVRKKGQRSLAIKVYSEVLSGQRKSFPRHYFTDGRYGLFRAEVCFKHLCKRILHYNEEQVAKEFSHSNGIKTLSRYKLKILLNANVFGSLTDMIYQIYPSCTDRLAYYQHLQDGRYNRKGGKKNGNSKRICDTSRKASTSKRKAK